MAYAVYQDVYDRTGLSITEVPSTVVTSMITYAEAELEELTRRKWSSANAITETINAPQRDVIGITGSNNDTQSGGYATTINLSEYPIQSITSFTQVDVNGNAVATYGNLTSVQIAAGTYYTTDYWLDVLVDPITLSVIPYGKITLKSDIFAAGKNSIKVAYTYGYSAVPTVIKNLAVCLAGIRTWLVFMGGSYNRLNEYEIPQQSVVKGDFYVRCKRNVQELEDEANRILDRVGRKPRILFFASSDAR